VFCTVLLNEIKIAYTGLLKITLVLYKCTVYTLYGLFMVTSANLVFI